MSEFRHNIISREWVIICPERAHRPTDYMSQALERPVAPGYKHDCPFCPGNEKLAAHETFCLGTGRGWKVRVVENKYHALSSTASKQRSINGIFQSMPGFGIHNVVVEHPNHAMTMPAMSDAEVTDVMYAYKNRYEAFVRDPAIEAVIICKNFGPSAGTSLEHPHSQIIATPIVPPQLRKRVEQAAGFFDDTGSCIFCHTLSEERRDGRRMVEETEHCAAFVPFAALSPYHVWIFPKRHMTSFAHMSEVELRDFAKLLRRTLMRLAVLLNSPDYNFAIRSIPAPEKDVPYFHWYLSIVPRVHAPAGFELGSGMYLNVHVPEEDAAELRQTPIV